MKNYWCLMRNILLKLNDINIFNVRQSIKIDNYSIISLKQTFGSS